MVTKILYKQKTVQFFRFTVGKDAYGLSNPAEGPFCFEPVKKGIPKYWSIEERPGKSILAFHLLPQTARRVHAWKDDNTWAVKEKPTDAPACLGQLSITFVSFFDLLN